MNNEKNQNGREQPFKVNIEDDGFLNPEDLDRILPPQTEFHKKKFEVHIDEDDDISNLDFQDNQPQYKGEIYFSNRKPARRPVQQIASQPGKVSSAKNSGKKFVINSVVAVFCVVVLLFTTAFSAIAISCINDVFAINRSEEKIKITIPQNSTTDDIIEILNDEGLIKQELFCKIFYKGITFLKNINKDPKPAEPTYHPGVYIVKKNLGLEGYLTEFREIQKSADTITLVFPEGWTIYQMFNKIVEFGVCSKEELLASIQGTDFENEFISEIPENSDRTFKLEGYLYPDTYEFYETSDANTIIRKFLEASENKWTDEYEAQRIKLGLTRDEVITIASIIQREAANEDQMGLVSSVLHNRLNNRVSWPTLGCDSTANYISNYVAPNVSASQAASLEESYNTYYCEGLPPGPICNPGDDAIYAALFPEDTDYYYFRHDKYGEIYMAKTQAEHDANGREVLRANSR